MTSQSITNSVDDLLEQLTATSAASFNGGDHLETLEQILDGKEFSGEPRPDVNAKVARLRAQAALAEGSSWSTLWSECWAADLEGNMSGFDSALRMARFALRRGHGSLAIEAYERALRQASSNDDTAIRLELARAFRVTGQGAEAQMILKQLLREPLQEQVAAEVRWEVLCLRTQASRRMNEISMAVGPGGSHRSPRFLLEANLWSLGLPTPRNATLPLRCDTLRRLFPGEVTGPDHHIMWQILRGLEGAAEKSGGRNRRMNMLREVLGTAARLGRVDEELLVWAAGLTMLRDQGLFILATSAELEYRALSFRLSGGDSSDVLGIVGPEVERYWWDRAGKRKNPALPSPDELDIKVLSPTRDALKIAATVLELAALAARAKGRQLTAKLGGGPAKSVSSGLAELAFRRLAEFKGPIMKLAQSMSAFGVDLPPAVLEQLGELHLKSRHLPAVIIRGEVERELHAPVNQLFATWDDVPIAAASIGQVHTASLANGTRVAVKVRYPGARAIVESSFRWTRLLEPMLRPRLPIVNFSELMADTRARYGNECDFVQEARAQRVFATTYAADADVIVPAVIDSHSCESVLTSIYIDGQHLRDFITTASDSSRNKAAETILRVTLDSMYRHGLFLADPHPGNFLFCNDRVAFLDFGYTCQFDANQMARQRRLVRELVFNESGGQTIQFWEDLGYVGNKANFDPKAMAKVFRDLYYYPFLAEGQYRFSMEAYLESARTFRSAKQLRNLRIPPPDMPLISVMYGLYNVLAQLGGAVPAQQLLVEALD